MHITNGSGNGPLGAVALLLRAIGSGVLCLLLAWVGVVAAQFWRIKGLNAKHGVAGLGAVAGGWTFLLRSPLVVLVLSIAFGIGFYLAARWASQ